MNDRIADYRARSLETNWTYVPSQALGMMLGFMGSRIFELTYDGSASNIGGALSKLLAVQAAAAGWCFIAQDGTRPEHGFECMDFSGLPPGIRGHRFGSTTRCFHTSGFGNADCFEDAPVTCGPICMLRLQAKTSRWIFSKFRLAPKIAYPPAPRKWSQRNRCF